MLIRPNNEKAVEVITHFSLGHRLTPLTQTNSKTLALSLTQFSGDGLQARRSRTVEDRVAKAGLRQRDSDSSPQDRRCHGRAS